MKRKLLSWLLVVALVITMGPGTAFAQTSATLPQGEPQVQTQGGTEGQPANVPGGNDSANNPVIDVSNGGDIQINADQYVGKNVTLTGTKKGKNTIYIDMSGYEGIDITLKDLHVDSAYIECIEVITNGNPVTVNVKVVGDNSLISENRNISWYDLMNQKSNPNIKFQVEPGGKLYMKARNYGTIESGFNVSLLNTAIKGQMDTNLDLSYENKANREITLLNDADKMMPDGKGYHSSKTSPETEPCTFVNYISAGEAGHQSNCTECGYISTESHDRNGHAKSNFDGTHTQTCSKCGYYHGERIKCTPDNDKYNNDNVKYHSRNCSACGEEIKDTRELHEWEFVSDVKSPTETELGIAEYKCKVCGVTQNFKYAKNKSVINVLYAYDFLPEIYVYLNGEKIELDPVKKSAIAFGKKDKLIVFGKVYDEENTILSIVDPNGKKVTNIDAKDTDELETVHYSNVKKDGYADMTELNNTLKRIPKDLSKFDGYKVNALKNILDEKPYKFEISEKQPAVDKYVPRLKAAIKDLNGKDNVETKNITLSGEDVLEITQSGYKLNNGAENTYQGKYVLSGTGKQVKITSGYQHITVKDLTLAGTEVDTFSINNKDKVTLILDGENSFSAKGEYAGLYVNSGSEIDIKGQGKLTSKSSLDGAGIGGSDATDDDAGNINIYSGTIIAESGQNGAGIGGADDGICKNIRICGGNITAKSRRDGAGIGNGNDEDGHGGNIEIYGGNITAESGDDGAAIGNGNGSDDEAKIVIKGGFLNLKSNYGAAIGGGNGEHGGQIEISDTVVIADPKCDVAIGPDGNAHSEDYIKLDNATLFYDDSKETWFDIEPTDFNGKPVEKKVYDVDRADGLVTVTTSKGETFQSYVKNKKINIFMTKKGNEDTTIKVSDPRADYKRVDEALGCVPDNYEELFTKETADALKLAIEAVDRNETLDQQAEVDLMADNIYNAVVNLVEKDTEKPAEPINKVANVKVKTDNGLLKVTFDKVPGADSYRVYIKEVGAKEGFRWYYGNSKGTLIKQLYKKPLVKNGKYQIKVTAIKEGMESVASKVKTVYANRIGTNSAKMYAPKIASITFNKTKIKTAKVIANKVYVKNTPKRLQYKISYRLKGTKTWKSAGYSAKNVKYINGLKRGNTYIFALRYRYQSSLDGKTYIYSTVAYRAAKVR